MSRCPHWPLAFVSRASDSGRGCGNVPRRPATAEPGWQSSQDNVTPPQTPHPTHPQPGCLTADPRGPLATPTAEREVGQRTRGCGKRLWLNVAEPYFLHLGGKPLPGRTLRPPTQESFASWEGHLYAISMILRTLEGFPGGQPSLQGSVFRLEAKSLSLWQGEKIHVRGFSAF